MDSKAYIEFCIVRFVNGLNQKTLGEGYMTGRTGVAPVDTVMCRSSGLI